MPELLTTDQVAKELNCTPQWVTYLLRENKLRGRKLRQEWIVTREDLEAFKAEKSAK